jgi:hypothetical protein
MRTDEKLMALPVGMLTANFDARDRVDEEVPLRLKGGARADHGEGSDLHTGQNGGIRTDRCPRTDVGRGEAFGAYLASREGVVAEGHVRSDEDVVLEVTAIPEGKPMIISTGMAGLAELDETVRTARGAGCDDLILLKCTSTYPASPENTNLKTIPHLQEMFGVQVGLSDHTMGVGASVAAVAMGATLIEKHFTLSRADGGVDSAFSLEPHELKSPLVETESAWQALGSVTYGPTAGEKNSLQFRRSLYVGRDMEAGEAFTKENLRTIRPGFGLPPKYYGTLLGKRVNRDVPKGTPVTWDLTG